MIGGEQAAIMQLPCGLRGRRLAATGPTARGESAVPQLMSTDLQELRTRVAGEVVAPEDAAYDEAQIGRAHV